METKKKLGLTAQIYAASFIDGLSVLPNGCKNVTIIDREISGPSEPNESYPEVVLIRRDIDGGYIHAEPASHSGKKHLMFGGRFIWTSDSRMRTTISRRSPIPLHDRCEG